MCRMQSGLDVTGCKKVSKAYFLIFGTTVGFFGDAYHSGPISGAILQLQNSAH